jgi:hypothetical protein
MYEAVTEHIGGGMICHPTVDRWVIDVSGIVRIHEVAIVACADILVPETYKTLFLLAPGPDSDWKQMERQYDLDAWIGSYAPHLQNFAVAIATSPHGIYGILLKQIFAPRMLKVGTFRLVGKDGMSASSLPEIAVRHVDWEVN